jgi:hypothetical protein
MELVILDSRLVSRVANATYKVDCQYRSAICLELRLTMNLYSSIGSLSTQTITPILVSYQYPYRSEEGLFTLHIDTLSPRSRSISFCVMPSIWVAVFKINNLNISACVESSTTGNWMPWLVESSFPKGFRLLAYFMLSSMQYSAAPRELAACRSRFSCTKV